MATEKNISIRQGRTTTIVTTVTGISDWTGMVAKFVVETLDTEAEEKIDLAGSIDAGSNKVTFAITHDHTKDLDPGDYGYEIIIYKADKSYIQEPNYGKLKIREVLLIDPTA